MKTQITTALIALLVIAGLILLWPKPEEPELPVPVEEDTPKESNTSRQTAPLITQPGSSSITGKGVSVSLNDLSNFKAGDAIALFIPQEDSVHKGRITDVSMTESGNRVITGFLDGNHRFIFTVGQFQTFGTIQTQAGRYQLETRDGAGKIVSVQAIKENLDFTQPDYVIPEKILPTREPQA